MAFFPMTIGGKKYTETSLWTNNAPTSSFAAQTVNLSESIENFKYIGIKYCYNNVSYQTVSMAVYTVDELKASLASSGADHNIITLGLMSSGNVGYCRNVFYSSNTSIAFSTGYKMNASGTSNNACNPLEIFGLNELDHGKRFDETSLWTNSSPTSTFAAQTVTLSESVDNYDYIGIKYYYNTSYNTGDCISMNIASLDDIKKWHYNGSTRHNIGSIAIQDNTNTAYSRNVFLVSNTEVRFGTAYQVGSGTVSNTTCIPLEIIGLKFA